MKTTTKDAEDARTENGAIVEPGMLVKGSIEKCVTPIRGATLHSIRLSVGHKPAAISAAICAVMIYLCVALYGVKLYSKFCRRAVDELPCSVDVLVAGNSVIFIPLTSYEFPFGNRAPVLNRPLVMESPRFERLLTSFGSPNLSVYNGSASGQSIEETLEFVQGFTAQKKHPHLMLLFVAPAAMISGAAPQTRMISGAAPQTRSFFPPVDGRLQKSEHELAQFHYRIQSLLAVITLSVYSKLHLSEPHRAEWERVQTRYRSYYTRKLSQHKLEALRQILGICKNHSIRTLVVSTPLSPSNRALLSEFSYEDYHRAMREVVQRARGEGPLEEDEAFVDLGQSPEFVESSDFGDSAHCNGKGGEKMLRLLAPKLVQLVRQANALDLANVHHRRCTDEVGR